jgi:hypothetical protein
VDDERFDPGLLDEEDPFEVDAQAAHLFKHPHLGIDDIDDVWASDPPVLSGEAARALADVRGDRWPGAGGATGPVAQRRPSPVPPDRLLRGLASACRPVQERPEEMTTPMTPDEEYAFYARPENQEPQGPARLRDGTRLSAPVPVRFPPELLEQARRAADADDRSLSSWIRLAVEHELRRSA